MPKPSRPLDPVRLATLFKYEPESGKLFSLVSKKHVGRTDKQGYLSVDVPENGRRRTILAHRIAFCLMQGKDIPIDKFVDHINRIKSDNRWDNLRLVSHTQNMINSSQPRSTYEGLPSGVYANPKSSTKPYKVKIHVGGKPKYFGSFATVNEAADAAEAARAEAWNDARP